MRRPPPFPPPAQGPLSVYSLNSVYSVVRDLCALYVLVVPTANHKSYRPPNNRIQCTPKTRRTRWCKNLRSPDLMIRRRGDRSGRPPVSNISAKTGLSGRPKLISPHPTTPFRSAHRRRPAPYFATLAIKSSLCLCGKKSLCPSRSCASNPRSPIRKSATIQSRPKPIFSPSTHRALTIQFPGTDPNMRRPLPFPPPAQRPLSVYSLNSVYSVVRDLCALYVLVVPTANHKSHPRKIRINRCSLSSYDLAGVKLHQ